MKRLFTACGMLLSCGLWAACSPPFAIFEDVGTDPHPPEVTIVGVAYQPVADADGFEPPPEIKPLEGFVVHPLQEDGSTLLFRVQYKDVGGDVQSFKIRDRDSALDQELRPTAPQVDLDGDGVIDTVEAPNFFSGTSGTADLQDVELSSTMMGAHRLEIWAVDSHGSRSEKATFTLEVGP
jgi:hypothetical protein